MEYVQGDKCITLKNKRKGFFLFLLFSFVHALIQLGQWCNRLLISYWYLHLSWWFARFLGANKQDIVWCPTAEPGYRAMTNTTTKVDWFQSTLSNVNLDHLMYPFSIVLTGALFKLLAIRCLTNRPSKLRLIVMWFRQPQIVLTIYSFEASAC